MSVISVKSLSKSFMISHEKDALVRSILPYVIKPVKREEIWALKDVAFDLEAGESLGVIGLNGAGKSVLLNVLAGITTPTLGAVNINGKVSTLLTLGAGFITELTGEENIFLNGTILGMSIKEIKRKFKPIVDFSELGSFIDAPIQTYSAGMLMRLGFSVAIHVDFDILLIDEILSVGDIGFSEKCLSKLEEFKKQGKTLVIASQSVDFINEIAEKAIYLKKGAGIAYGGSKAVTRMYLESVKRSDSFFMDIGFVSNAIEKVKHDQSAERVGLTWGSKIGTKEVEIIDVGFYSKDGIKVDSCNTGDPLKIKVKYKVNKEVLEPHFGVAIFRKDKVYCYGPNTKFDNFKIDKLRAGEGEFSIYYPKLILSPGEYYLSIAIWEKDELFPYDYHCAYYKLTVDGDGDNSLFYQEYNGRSVFVAEGQIGPEIGIRIMDEQGKERDVFRTEGFVTITAEVLYNKRISSILIKVYREDGVLCFVMAAYPEKSLFTKKGIKAIWDIQELNLLIGRYYISAEAADVNKNILLKKDGIKSFSVITEKEDHGIVCMPHRWTGKGAIEDGLS